ncbi:TetR family transcriptional regulator [Gordonia pseudamarae]|uniref:TetR family transcriptional regulator n=1 Tax=Gordonia pseudamarae TaxID=2831662 RepID=A0ABX6ILH6_9ACTN|nr:MULTISPECIES: TetR family transcriptional regulator [Gordonia]MBD0021788.1 TetR family transcriptional regulator [Gordonia sp. (in: high G+C Gram-positive bacteria)]QHN27915.1 TetR family transcriptional regulator [Gordonia pseudamarae]QHN36772.1 TetR family transcriptional regulator [Gordonia pseudamarae]
MGRKPLIAREDAVAAALEIIDTDGPGALSLERVAGRLGVKAPSLYNHFSDKAEILAEVARAVLLEVPVVPDPAATDDWKSWLVEASTAVRHTLLTHQRAAPIVVEYFPRGMLERLYAEYCRILGEHGVPPRFQMFILEAVHRMTIGSAVCVATGRPEMATPSNPAAFDTDVVDALHTGDWSGDRFFTGMLHAFLDGIEVQIGRESMAGQALPQH